MYKIGIMLSSLSQKECINDDTITAEPVGTDIKKKKTLSQIRYFINNMIDVQLTNNTFCSDFAKDIKTYDVPMLYGESDSIFTEYCLSYLVKGQRMYLGFYNVCDEEIIFSVDEQFNIRRLPCDTWILPASIFQGCLFDVKYLVKDQTYVITDTIACNGRTVISVYYPYRLEIARQFLHDLIRLGYAKVHKTVPYFKYAYKSNFKNMVISLISRNSSNNDNNTIKTKFLVKSLFYPKCIKYLADDKNVVSKLLQDHDLIGFIWTPATVPYPVVDYVKHSRNLHRERTIYNKFSTIYQWKFSSKCQGLRITAILVPSTCDAVAKFPWVTIPSIASKYRITSSGIYYMFLQEDLKPVKLSYITSFELSPSKLSLCHCKWVDNNGWTVVNILCSEIISNFNGENEFSVKYSSLLKKTSLLTELANGIKNNWVSIKKENLYPENAVL